MPRKPKLSFVLVCVFLDALCFGLIIPVLPRLIGTLSASPGAQATWYGLIMLSYGLTQFVSAPLLGALSDRLGRRPVLLGGIFGLGLMMIVPALTVSLPLILISRVVGGMMSANTTVAQAYIADLTVGIQRFAGFGRIGALFGVGFVIGPALGGLLGQSDPRLPFLVSSALCLLNFTYGLLVLPESLRAPAAGPFRWRDNNPLGAIARLLCQPVDRPLVMTLVLTGLSQGLVQCTWALYTEFRYGFTPRDIGFSMFALGLSIALAQGWLLPRLLGRCRVALLVPAVIAAGAAALLTIAGSSWGLLAAIACCCYGVSGCASPLITGDISRRAEVTDQGRTIGSISSLHSLTGAIAPAIGTPLLVYSASAGGWLAGLPYHASALLMIGALLLSLIAFRDSGASA